MARRLMCPFSGARSGRKRKVTFNDNITVPSPIWAELQ